MRDVRIEVPLEYAEPRSNGRIRTRIFPFHRSCIRSFFFFLAGVLCLLYFLDSFNGPHRYLSLPYPRHGGPPGHHHEDVSTSNPDKELWDGRAEAVKEAFLHAWHAYERGAWGADELLPINGKGTTKFNGWGVTIVDSLDTLWLMGLKVQFRSAVNFVSKMDFRMARGAQVPFFETVIRYLGGLLSAYALSGETVFLTRADELGLKLLPIFNTTTGLPLYSVDLDTGRAVPSGWTNGRVLLAEMASCQMEYKYLAHLTGRREYFDKVDKVMEIMEHNQRTDGLFDTFWDHQTGKSANVHATLGSWSDSAYEYLLKQYLLSGRTETRVRNLYMSTTAGALKQLMFLSRTRNLLFASSRNGYGVAPTGLMDHLACFYPGLLALGTHLLSPSSSTPSFLSESASDWRMPTKEAELHKWAAQGLAQTCYTMYADSMTGLGAEETIFKNLEPGGWDGASWTKIVEEWDRRGRKPVDGAARGKPAGVADEDEVERKTGKGGNGRGGKERDYTIQAGTWLSRPETIETYFIMWKTTKDPIWRERGWKAFQAIEKYAKTNNGYTSIRGVDVPRPERMNEMPSYFLAETLKYLYLLFIDEDLIPLDKWVLTTEAHPLPVFEWSEQELKQYGIR